MDQSVRIGRAFRDDHLVADELELIEQAELRITEVPVAGGARSVVRQRVIRGPSMIRFTTITDEGFRSDLNRLAEASRDPDVGRRVRGWLPEPIDLVMDDGAAWRGVAVQRPLNGYGGAEAIRFNIAVPGN